MIHIPVLQKEVLQYLDPKPNKNFVDATIDGGGHTIAILKKNKPSGKILGIELDNELYQRLKLRMAEFPISNFQFSNRFVLVNDSYTNLKKIVVRYKFKPINGILFDLGMSSWHLEESGRGFSFMMNEPLDMRYQTEIPNPKSQIPNSNGLTAERIINTYPREEIEKILREYGEERFSRRIAKKIAEERKIKSIKNTFQLVEIIKKIVPFKKSKIHPATRTFQALRIAVNDELNNLRKVLPQAIEVLAPGGKIVIISFHSLEDRIVKKFFKEEFKKGSLEILTKKPVKTMNNTLTLNHPLIIKPLKKLITLRLFWFLAVLSAAALLVFYVFQINAAVSERYSIQKYEKRTSEISRENQNLEISSAQTNSLDNVTAFLGELNFEKVNKIHYIRVLDTRVVTK